VSPRSKREYFENVRHRYQAAKTSADKTRLLDELCSALGYHRKWAIAKLGNQRPKRRKRRKPGPRSLYNREEVKKVLIEVWMAANMPCSKRLKVILPLWMSSYEESFGRLEAWVKSALDQISPSSIDRVMTGIRRKYRGRGRSTTKPGLLLRHQVPIKVNQWDEHRPGFIEADTVAHCGTSVAGLYVNTLDAVDIGTGWTEQEAILGKGMRECAQAFGEIEKRLPFEILGIDCDNGSEFLNEDVIRYCYDNRSRKIEFTRSRAYKKDDNAHVEQKNWTHVRQWLGYRRFEDPQIVPLMNDLYRTEWRLFHNFFMPSVKLLEKKRIGSKLVKLHDSPKTPYQRILESPHIEKSIKEQLKKQIQGLNPFRLRKIINDKIRKIHALAR
jgi:hypothetical protein